MENYSGEQVIRQLDKGKGGYFFLETYIDIVNQLQTYALQTPLNRQTNFKKDGLEMSKM